MNHVHESFVERNRPIGVRDVEICYIIAFIYIENAINRFFEHTFVSRQKNEFKISFKISYLRFVHSSCYFIRKKFCV